MGRFDEAVESLEKAVAQAPDIGRFLLILTKAYIAGGDELQARRTFERYSALSKVDVKGYEDFRQRTLEALADPDRM